MQNFSDSNGGMNVDVLSYGMAHDCGTATWALTLGASAAFNADIFDYTAVFLDTDMNAGTGDLGDDYAVVAFFDDNDLFNLVVIKTPTSNSATWSVTGTPGFHQSQNLLSLTGGTARSARRSQFRWGGEFSTLVDAGIDTFPNAGWSHDHALVAAGPRAGAARAVRARRPTRIMDTRAGGAAAKPFSGSTLRHTVAGVGPVPADAIAVALNVTATEAEGSGFVTVFPNGPTRPFASNLNFTSGQNIANLVVAPIGSQGKVSFYTHQPTHLIADVMGYWVPAASSAGGRYQPLQASAPARHPLGRQARTVPDHPVRRERPGRRTGQRRECGRAQPHAHGVHRLGLGRGLPRRDHVGRSSNLNVQGAGQTVPNLVIVPVGGNGMVNLLTLTGGHLVADVAGYFTDGTAPARRAGSSSASSPSASSTPGPASPRAGARRRPRSPPASRSG